MDQQPALSCDVCDRDASATVLLARWHDCHVCPDCLATLAARGQAGLCACLDCLRHQQQHGA